MPFPAALLPKNEHSAGLRYALTTFLYSYEVEASRIRLFGDMQKRLLVPNWQSTVKANGLSGVFYARHAPVKAHMLKHDPTLVHAFKTAAAFKKLADEEIQTTLDLSLSQVVARDSYREVILACFSENDVAADLFLDYERRLFATSHFEIGALDPDSYKLLECDVRRLTKTRRRIDDFLTTLL